MSRCKLSYIQFYNIKFKKSQAQIVISLIWIVVIFVQITALLFTFSRSAWVGFAISITTLLFLLCISRFNNVSRETLLNFKERLNCYLLVIFVSFLVISLFDHYFWTLQQGRLIFWLVLGMLLIDVRFKAKDD